MYIVPNENVGRLELRHDGIYRCEDEVRDGLHWVLVLPKNHLETAIAKQPTPIAGEGELAQKLAEHIYGTPYPTVPEMLPIIREYVAERTKEARIDEANKWHTNWNVDESIRSFDVWAKARIAELEAKR